MKIVVFDLDETLGYFVEYAIFWDCLHKYLSKNNINYKLNQHEFNNILDLYPEFLRPNILHILNYLKNKKQTKGCNKIMIYTNNKAAKTWASQIISYFESKINYKLFDQIIAAFKINGTKIELGRTTHNKCVNDLIKCTKIPVNSEICFLDDNYFPGMADDNVYYINVKPYTHDLEFIDMIDRFINSDIGNMIINKEEQPMFTVSMLNIFKMFRFNCLAKDEKEYEIDKIIGKDILSHLQIFFNRSLKNKTKRHNSNKKNRTKKNL